MSRIFVVQEQPHINVSPALNYGDELIFMLPPGNHAFNPTRMAEKFKDVIEEKNFSEDDYLLLVGDPVAIASAAIHVATWLEKPPLKVLKWDRQSNRYLPIEI